MESVARGWRAFGVYKPRVVRPWLYVTRDHGDPGGMVEG
jgi:hypothetical protein